MSVCVFVSVTSASQVEAVQQMFSTSDWTLYTAR